MSTPPTDIAATVNDITAQLQETNPPAVLQIRRIVEKIGIEAAYTFLQQTLEVEAQGGTLTADKTRRRTPCGTYFYIVRGQIPVETRNILWPRTKRPSRNSLQETSKETAKSAVRKEMSSSPMASSPKSRPAQISFPWENKKQSRTGRSTALFIEHVPGGRDMFIFRQYTYEKGGLYHPTLSSRLFQSRFSRASFGGRSFLSHIFPTELAIIIRDKAPNISSNIFA